MDITALLAMTAGRPGATPRSDAGGPAAAADFAALLTRAAPSVVPAPLAQRPAGGEAGPDLAALAQALDLEPKALARMLDDAIAALSTAGELPEALSSLTENGELPEALASLTENGELPEALATALDDAQANLAEGSERSEALTTALDNALTNLATRTESGELPELLRPLADGLAESQAPESLPPLLAALGAASRADTSPAQAAIPQTIAPAQAMPQDPRLAEIATRLALVAAPEASPGEARPADGALQRLSAELASLAGRRGEGIANGAATGRGEASPPLPAPQDLEALARRQGTDTRLMVAVERPAPLPSLAQVAPPAGGMSRAVGIGAGLPGPSQGAAAQSQGLHAPITASLSTELASLAGRRGEGVTNGTAPGQGETSRPLLVSQDLAALAAQATDARLPVAGHPAPPPSPPVAQAPLPAGDLAPEPGMSRATGIEAGLPGPSQGAAAAPQAGLPQGLPQGLAAPATASLSAPLATQAWEQQLGQQLVGLAQRGGQVELHLHPAELGPLSVSLKLGDQGAQAQFLSAHAQVRQAVEQALPQLREALAEQGIQLADTSVGEQRGERHDGLLAQGESGARGGEPLGDEAPALTVDTGRRAASLAASLRGGVDLFA